MMTETTEEQQLVSKWKKVVHLSAVAAGLFFLTASAALVLVVFSFLFQSCPMNTNCSHRLKVTICGGAAVFLFLVGAFTLLSLRKRRRKMSFPPQRVVSEIPAQDVEKSPRLITGIQPLTHNPHRFHVYATFSQNIDAPAEVSQSIASLPNYFSALRYSPEDGAKHTADLTTMPPPSYQEVIEMEAIGRSVLTSSDVADRNISNMTTAKILNASANLSEENAETEGKRYKGDCLRFLDHVNIRVFSALESQDV